MQFLSFLSFIWKKSIVQLSSICQLTLYLYFPEQSLEKINCVTTFEGVYQFSYEVDTGGGGICNHPDSQIKACQEPGSQYVDNDVFVMTYRKCLDVSTSKNERMSCLQLNNNRFMRNWIWQWFLSFFQNKTYKSSKLWNWKNDLILITYILKGTFYTKSWIISQYFQWLKCDICVRCVVWLLLIVCFWMLLIIIICIFH